MSDNSVKSDGKDDKSDDNEMISRADDNQIPWHKIYINLDLLVFAR